MRQANTWIGTLILAAILGTIPSVDVAIAREETDGYMYGKVTTKSGSDYTGLIRWGAQESFWDDHFNATKDELEYIDHQPRDERRNRSSIRLFGFKVGVHSDRYEASRVFACRFGDIDRLETDGRDAAILTMRSGTEFYVTGYSSNDIGPEVTVRDPMIGDIDIPWKKIDTIEFLPTPRGVEPAGFRLRGVVETDIGEFTGYIQWDSDECLSVDKLDGESSDGKLSIEMGKIRSIERRRNRSQVELKDGRTFVLDGSNDVDSSIRGILVEDPRYGRVKVQWDSFERAIFEDAGGSGESYERYASAGSISGKVTDSDGETHSGRIVFDLDETETWEFFNGKFSDVEFNIPFSMIRTIEPKGRRSTEVVLESGERLRLRDGQDVTEDNDGVLIFVNGEDEEPVYLNWRDVELIELDG